MKLNKKFSKKKYYINLLIYIEFYEFKKNFLFKGLVTIL